MMPPKNIWKLSLFEFIQMAIIVGGFIWFAAELRSASNYGAMERANMETHLQKIDAFGSFKLQSHEATDDQRVEAITKRMEAAEAKASTDHDAIIRMDENIKELLRRVPVNH